MWFTPKRLFKLIVIFFCIASLQLILQKRDLRISIFSSLTDLFRRGEYTILCLGETVTILGGESSNSALGGENSYPKQLERILNTSGKSKKFRVINKGALGIISSSIVTQLNENLKKYKPDMVIVMMGINDDDRQIPYEATSGIKIVSGSEWPGVFQLKRGYLTYITNVIRGRVDFSSRNKIKPVFKQDNQRSLKLSEELFKKAKELNLRTDGAYNGLVWHGGIGDKLDQVEALYNRVIELNPYNDKAYTELAWCYRFRDNLVRSEELFKTAIKLNPSNDDAYAGLGWCYRMEGWFLLAKDYFLKAIELNKRNYGAYIGLGRCYKKVFDFVRAEESFIKAIEINPLNDGAYFGLGQSYFDRREYVVAEEPLKKAIELNPVNDRAYLCLAWIYINKKEYQKAEKILLRGIALKPACDRLYGVLGLLYSEEGRESLGQQYYDQANTLRLRYLNPVTRDNYRALKKILDKKKIRLVCVQYPVQSIEYLKEYFDDHSGIIFVDNEMVFKKAFKKSSCTEYFIDIFAGDFGHCTVWGNKLLAENIASVILNESLGIN